MTGIAVIIVTHDSQPVIADCLKALLEQHRPVSSIIIVDSGSMESDYLDTLSTYPNVRIIKEKNIGFATANNIGYRSLAGEIDYVLFLNPDAFVEPTVFELAIQRLENEPSTGCLTGRLLSFDQEKGCPSGSIDSTGIFRKWYGRWYDRGQGEPDNGQYAESEEILAACGAFMFCRKSVLDEMVTIDGHVFDPDFFLYKEDIELSLRLRSRGWRIVYYPELKVFHCRGWDTDRCRMSYAKRLMSARNEIMLYRKHPSPYILWAVCKYVLVRMFRV